MDIFVLVSKVLGIYLVVSGLFLIFRAKTVPLLLKDFFDHPAIGFLTGVILIFLSSMFLLVHNVWNNSWQTIITVFAWLTLLKGLAYIFIPSKLSVMTIKKFRGWANVWGVVAIVIGCYLFYLG
jgi:hypothetical protein